TEPHVAARVHERGTEIIVAHRPRGRSIEVEYGRLAIDAPEDIPGYVEPGAPCEERTGTEGGGDALDAPEIVLRQMQVICPIGKEHVVPSVSHACYILKREALDRLVGLGEIDAVIPGLDGYPHLPFSGYRGMSCIGVIERLDP